MAVVYHDRKTLDVRRSAGYLCSSTRDHKGSRTSKAKQPKTLILASLLLRGAYRRKRYTWRCNNFLIFCILRSVPWGYFSLCKVAPTGAASKIICFWNYVRVRKTQWLEFAATYGYFSFLREASLIPGCLVLAPLNVAHYFPETNAITVSAPGMRGLCGILPCRISFGMPQEGHAVLFVS